MKQTLLKFALDNWFGIETRDTILHLGIGFLLIPWLLLGMYEAISARRAGHSFREQAGSLAVWAGIAVAVLLVPFVANALPFEAVPVFGWGFMLVLGFVSAGWFTLRRGKRIGLTAEMVGDLGLQCMIGGILGARVFHLIQYHEQAFKGVTNPIDFIKKSLMFMDGGMVLFGGLFVGSAAGIWFCRRHKIPVLLMTDVLMPAIFLGIAFGRLGCLMNGCCYGDACTLPWGLQFPAESIPWKAAVEAGWNTPNDPYSIPLHPTQIYSAINGFILAGLTSAWFWKRRADGDTAVLGLLTYPVTRFTIEFLRSDEAGQFGTSLTISQWMSIGLFLGGIILWLAKPKSLASLPLKLPESESKESPKRK